ALDVDLDPADEPALKTLGNLLDRINAADPAKLAARISADGKRIELEDLTAGGGAFAVTSPVGGSLAEELGLTGAEFGGVIAGQRLISGLKTTLLGSLAGGDGLGALGSIQLTDRSGQTATVNLAAAETLSDVIETINAAGIGITASYNSAHNGLLLTDTTGSTASNLIVADGDATATATKLGLSANAAVAVVNSGSLARQTVSRNTLLSSYNGGRGIGTGTFRITDSAGQAATVNLTLLEAQTIGDVIDAINALSIGVEARLNDAGDGIAIVDTAGGSGALTIADNGVGKTAAGLHIAGAAVAGTIDGTTTHSVELDADDTLEDLVLKLNELDGGFSASVFDDGAGSLRYHLSLLGGVVGAAGQLVIDGSELGLQFQDVSTAQDALLQIGGGSTAGILVSSPTGKFDDVHPGLDTTLLAADGTTVTVSVSQTAEDVASALQLFVDQYNKLQEKLETYTAFDLAAGTKGTLFGTSEAVRLDSELSRLVTGRYFNDGQIRSLAELGVSIDDQGKLTLDKLKLEEKFNADPEAVSEFFADEERGFAPLADAALERLVGIDRSLLINRTAALQRKIEDFGGRIDAWNGRLDRSRQRLLLQFFRLEQVVGRIQNNLTAINQIQLIKPIPVDSSN
ncbi:MAG TPA: flagellar filament capping protein FliD, partial [Pirellulaceae bacterium]|nr:flagellar filament capping protein FliD [Pirellulaceae bacterium]